MSLHDRHATPRAGTELVLNNLFQCLKHGDTSLNRVQMNISSESRTKDVPSNLAFPFLFVLFAFAGSVKQLSVLILHYEGGGLQAMD